MQHWRPEKSPEYDQSVDAALSRCKGGKKKAALNLLAKIENLQKLSIEDIPKRPEDSFKDVHGNDRHFFALTHKKCIRIYVVPVKPDLLFFSHAIYKKEQKLDPQDTKRIQANFTEYQRSTTEPKT